MNAILLKFLLSLFVRLIQQCHLCRIDEVLKCGDSMIKLQTLSQIQSHCLYMQLSVCATAPRILTNFSPSHVKILFCTDKIESIEWQDLAQQQRTGDCSVIHPPDWGLCDRQLSSHRTFLLETSFSSASFAKGPCHFWFASNTSQFLVGSEYKNCASSILIPLSWDVPNLSPEKCVRVQAPLCSLDYLWNPPTIQEDLADGRSNVDCHPSFDFSFGFLRVIRTSLPGASSSLRS